MIKKIFATAIIVLVAVPSLFAQEDSTKSLVFSGSVDAYYRYNFANVDDGFNSNNYTSFTNSQSSFALGMASIRADATALNGKLAATADLGWGPRAQEFSYAEAPGSTTLAMVKQMFISYKVSDNVKITAGKFATHVGYEVVDPFLNKNYSMSYMFSYGPFSSTGIKADITAGSVGLMFGVANFVDESISTTTVKTLLGQVSTGSKNGNLKAYLNYLGFYGSSMGQNPMGLKSLTQLDVVVTGTVSDKFNIGFNGTMQNREQPDFFTGVPSGTWYGAAAYLNFVPSSEIGVTLRSEYINDSKQVLFSSNSIFANTISLNYQLGPFTLIPEFRFEFADDGFYTKHDGEGSSSTATVLMAAVYHF